VDRLIQLRLLGPVELEGCDGGGRQGGPQPRLLLALLGLSPGRVVPVADLIDALWEERPPPSARASVQILITRLRKSLAKVPGCHLDRYGDGYRLQVNPDLVDVHRFRSFVASARQSRDDDEAIRVLEQALELWRGPALADVAETARVEAIRTGLAEEHLSAVQDRIGRLLSAGRDEEAAFSLTQSLRILLAGQGVRVHAVLTGPVDTEMVRELDIPKSSPASVARAIFDGVDNGEEDIFPDPLSASMAESWRNGAAKALERQNAALV
jgi:DNA-binding winged helix-turn-helix (wHTH) protein